MSQQDHSPAVSAFESVGTTWSAAHVTAMVQSPSQTIPIISASDAAPILPGHDLWDLWPVQLANGAIADIAGGALWMLLSAPWDVDPNARHDVARIRLMHRIGSRWRDIGLFLPEGHCPGKREWAGSAVYEPDCNTITLYYTVAGRRSESAASFEQRLFEVAAHLVVEGDTMTVSDFGQPIESVVADGDHYVIVDAKQGVPGFIKGFRDPAYFRDSASGREYLIFTGSSARSSHAFNGVIGIASREPHDTTRWRAAAPLISADGLNNEMERAHVVEFEGRYYVFWSTQRKMFSPGGPAGPTGLYGMVADTLAGPYTPLNGSGLVAANPAAEPDQSYSWWVCGDLRVVSFIDQWGCSSVEAPNSPDNKRAHFGGTPAPEFSLELRGATTRIVTK